MIPAQFFAILCISIIGFFYYNHPGINFEDLSDTGEKKLTEEKIVQIGGRKLKKINWHDQEVTVSVQTSMSQWSNHLSRDFTRSSLFCD